MKPGTFILLLMILAMAGFTGCTKSEQTTGTWYVNSISGDDSGNGLTPETAWKSLKMANKLVLQPGDKLMLAKGSIFRENLVLQGAGTREHPVIVGAYDSGNPNDPLPVIDAKGYVAAIQIENGGNFEISDLELTSDVSDDQDTKVADASLSISNVVFTNNLWQKTSILPESLSIKDVAPLIGDPQFKFPGGTDPENYIPQNIELIMDMGIAIEKIPGDETGLTIGLAVKNDYFGNPVTGTPDMGAVEIK